MTQSASITHSISSLIVLVSILLSVMVSSSRTESRVNRNDRVPLFSDCRFWVDPASHMRLLRQKMNSNNNGMNIRVFFWWNTKTGKCSRCRQCEGDKVTGVPCHFMSDTVCLDKDDLGKFLAERQGYYYAHPDYHTNDVTHAESSDSDVEEAVMVYNSNGRKENSPEIFGKKQYHPGSHSSNSLTSQIVKKRLNETGQLNKLQKLQSLQSAASDYGKPTFYSEDSEARTKNAAISSNTRPVLEVAKLFLGDGATSGADINNNSRFTKFQDIKQLLHTKANGDTETRNNFRVNDIKVETDYAQDYREVTVGDDQFALYYNQDNMVTTITTVNKVIHHQTQPVIATKQDLYTRTPNTPPPYSFGVQHYEMETDEITPSSDGDQAIREIFHYLEDDSSIVSEGGDDVDTLLMILGGVSAVVLVLISILGYVMIVKHKENHVSSDNKFSVLDDQVTLDGRELHPFTTRQHHQNNETETETVPCEIDNNIDRVPPAVIRSLKNIRKEREVIVDIEGRNVIR